MIRVPRSTARPSLHLGWTSAASGGLLLLVWGLIDAGSHGWTSWRALVPAVLGLAVLVGVAARIVRSGALDVTHGVDMGKLATGLGLVFLGVFAVTGPFFLLLIYLQRVQDLSPLEAGFVVLPFTAVAALLSPLVGRYVGLRGGSGLLPVAFLFEVAALVGLSRLGPSSSWAATVPYLVLLGLAMAAIATVTIALVVQSVPPERAGAASGAQSASLHIGSALSVAIVGSVLAASVGSLYQSALDRAGLPAPSPIDRADRSGLEQGIPAVPSGAQGDELRYEEAAYDAFAGAMGRADLVAVGAAGLGFLTSLGLVLRRRYGTPSGYVSARNRRT
jgi:hypothetical protein